MAKELSISAINPRVRHPTALAASGRLELVFQFWHEQIEQVLPDKPDLIVLPELCEVDDRQPLSQYVECAAEHDPELLSRFSKYCREIDAWLVLPTLRRAEDGTIRNSVRLLNRSGEVAGIYDKNNLTQSELQDGIVSGNRADVIETEFGSVGCIICFDLNFDSLRKRYAEQSPDLLLFCSMFHGGHVQQAWAYQCRSHLVTAVSDLPSAVLSPLGEVLASTTNYTGFLTHRINLDCCVVHLDHNLDKLKALKNKYGTSVEIRDPGLLGSVLVTSCTDIVNVQNLIEEFDIIRINDYLRQSS